LYGSREGTGKLGNCKKKEKEKEKKRKKKALRANLNPNRCF